MERIDSSVGRWLDGFTYIFSYISKEITTKKVFECQGSRLESSTENGDLQTTRLSK